MSTKEFIKRYILFMISLFFSAVGVAVTKHAQLGVAPVSSVPNIIFCRFPLVSLGMWLIIWNVILLVGQIIILRKNFRVYNLLQIPLAIAFGIFTDFGLWCISFLKIETFAAQLITVFSGVVIRSFGIALSVCADIILNSSEAFVKAVSDTSKYKFGLVKIFFDILCVTVSVILSIIMFEGEIIGTGIGTLIASVFTGMFVSIFLKIIHKPVNRLVTDN